MDKETLENFRLLKNFIRDMQEKIRIIENKFDELEKKVNETKV